MRINVRKLHYVFALCFIIFEGCAVIESAHECTVTSGNTCCCDCLCCKKVDAPLPPSTKNKYAVLISAGIVTQDYVAGNSEHWYDLVVQYKMLRESGFDKNNIYVLYGNGTDFDTINREYDSRTLFGSTITRCAVTKENIQLVFNTLSTVMTENDLLYVWWMGHGKCEPPDSCNLSLFIGYTDRNNDRVTDDELGEYINCVSHCKKRIIAIMACHSGGFIDDMRIQGNRTVTLTSSRCDQNSYSCDGRLNCDIVPHAEFNYTLTTALNRRDPCNLFVPPDIDRDHDNLISLREAHIYNERTMRYSTPQIGDPDGISALTCLKRENP